MNKREECCCVCLNTFLSLNELSQKESGEVTLMLKLQTSIPEIDWKQFFKICEPCTNLLCIVYDFRETCIKSDQIRKLQTKSIEKCIKNEEGTIYGDTKLEIDKPKVQSGRKRNDGSDSQNESDIENNCLDKEDSDNDINQNEEQEDYEDSEDDEDITELKKLPALKKRKRKNISFNCERCSDKFQSSTALVRHCVEEHGMNGKRVRPFACTRCDSRFINSSNLLQHIKYHEAVRSNICTYCGKGFITKTDLKIHEKQHMNMREYKCEDCFKCFNTHKDLRSHKLVVHTDPQLWKYFCTLCTKHFPIKSNYDSHMRRHTGDKRFECHLCDKKFTDKCVLQRHMRTHSNVRDFKCAHCNKEYKDKRVLQIHMAKIHNIGVGDIKLPSRERRYICHICPKAYYAKNKLTRHLYTHSGEKPFFCDICGKKFNDKSYVKQHMKRTHNIESY